MAALRVVLVVLAALLVPALGVDEFLSTCSSSVNPGGQDTLSQRLLFVEIGGAQQGVDPSLARGSCSAGVQSAFAQLQLYLTSKGHVGTYFALNGGGAPLPDLTGVDQVWVRHLSCHFSVLCGPPLFVRADAARLL
jgi:hypothetical protein